MLMKIGHIYQEKNHKQELRSLQYLGYHKNVLIVLSKKCFKNICFALSIKNMLYYLKFHFTQ